MVGNDREAKLKEKRDACLSLLTSSIITNFMATLECFEATPLALVPGIQKVPFNGRYLPPLVVVPLISAKEYLSLARVNPSLPEIKGLTRTHI